MAVKLAEGLLAMGCALVRQVAQWGVAVYIVAEMSTTYALETSCKWFIKQYTIKTFSYFSQLALK